MAWEQRKRGGSYYTRKLRRGKLVRSVYIGSGETAEIVARQDRFQRAQQEGFRLAEREGQAEFAQLEKQQAAYYSQVEDTMRQALQSAGYHQHKRGEWRKTCPNR